jgi:type II secretory ATPase GspE/PulE/Tfp pilus assembly ATPase PilB-like protein
MAEPSQGKITQQGAADAKAAVADVKAIVDDILSRAVQARASDVHFEPAAGELRIKFRLDGVLKEVQILPKAISENVITRLKVLGGLLTYRNDIPQEGHLHRTSAIQASDVLDYRISIFPTIHGQRAVVRLLYAQRSLTQLDELGFGPAMLANLRRLAACSQGLLLLTGPAGSGKSTTLAAMLRYILARFAGKSIVALEDPVEQQIDGVTQAQISPHGQMTFPVALRSLLRQDPQVLMIGEIRDALTAQIAVQAALTGHLLMSTMHSGTPAGALLRLLEMGIEPYQVTSGIMGVLNQRLVRRLCECGMGVPPMSGMDILSMRDRGKTPLEHMGKMPMPPKGCERCMGSGYSGRVLLAELVELDGELRKAILAKADLDELEAILQRRGHMNLRSDGARLVAKGITTQEEVDAACEPSR